MPKPIAEVLADMYTENGVQVLRVGEQAAEDVDRLIVKLHRELARLTLMVAPTTERHIKLLDKRARKLVQKTFAEVMALLDQEVRDIGKAETQYTRQALERAFGIAAEA